MSSPPDIVQVDDQLEDPVNFTAASSKRHRTLDALDFRGRVPVVLSFVGPGSGADERVRQFDHALHRFGELRVQLLLVVDEDPSVMSERIGANVTLIADDGLAAELHAGPDGHGRLASVILGNDGRALEVVRQLPGIDPSFAVLGAVELLAEQYPERFVVLPTDEIGSDRRQFNG